MGAKRREFEKLKNRIIGRENELKMHAQLCGPLAGMDTNKIKRLLKKEAKSEKVDWRRMTTAEKWQYGLWRLIK